MGIVVNGMLKIKTDIDSESVRINGMFKAYGKIKTEILENNGMFTGFNDIEAQTVHSNGVFKTSGKIKSEQITAEGVLRAPEIDAERVNINGKLVVEGTLNCDELDCTLVLSSSCHDIEASKVNIRREKKIVRFFKTPIQIHSVSADDIYLENVHCDYVTGDKITIGPECEIKKIDYRTSLEIDKTSHVKQEQQI